MRILQTLLWIIISIAIGYGLIVLLMYLLQSQMVYHPTDYMMATPSVAGLEYEEVSFQTEDKLELHGWFVPADSARPTVLYFHGNAGNISGRLEIIKLLNEIGLNVFIFDYRGYGRSEGSAEEAGTYRDAEAAWKHLVEERDIAPAEILIMGRSLGGSVAAWLAARKDAGAAIIESTFTSAADLGADLYPWLPVRAMLKFEYNTLEHVRNIDEPLFMAHSRDDEIVPYEHGKKLFDAAGEPKTFVELRGSHGSGFMETRAKYTDALRDFLEKQLNYYSKVNAE